MNARFTGRQWRLSRARKTMKLCACGRWYIEKCWRVCFECMAEQHSQVKP